MDKEYKKYLRETIIEPDENLEKIIFEINNEEKNAKKVKKKRCNCLNIFFSYFF